MAHFPQVNLSSEQVQLMIMTIDLEYTYTSDADLADLLAANFDLDVNEALATIRTHKATIEDDVEQISNEFMHYGTTLEL